jgi:hypothetical protein
VRFVVSLFCFAGLLFPQGIATTNSPAAARQKFSGRPFPATFVDVAKEAGLTAKFVQGQPDRKKYIIEANGTGVAFLDYDNDGLLDIFTVNSTRFVPFDKGQEPTNHLYRNMGDGKFSDVTTAAGLQRTGWGNGVCRGDFDNDGTTDLYVTYWGVNALYRNRGDGKFEDIAPRAGVAGPKEEWSTGCTFLDYDRDGRLDLFVVSYTGFDLKTTPLPGSHPFCMFRDQAVMCGPRGLPHGTVTLYRNGGDGSFEDVSAKSGVRGGQGCYGFTAAAADFNADAWTDIYVACDSTPSLFFRNNRDGTLTELATEAGIAYNEHGAEQGGMGIAVADFDNNGTLDLTKTNFIRDYPNLYRNIGKGIFEDSALAAGLAVNPEHVLWGTGFEDFDNDGLRDILQVGGHVYPELAPAEPYKSPRLIYRNLGSGRFEDVSHIAGPGIAEKHSSRGAAFGDFDNDGDVDVLVMNMDEPPSLLRNDLKGENAWIKVQAVGKKSNRSAIGATITIHAEGQTQTVPVLSQSSFLSVNDPRVHFGLGAAQKIDKIVVQWPSGVTEEFSGAEARSLAVLEEGAGRAKTVSLQR